MDRIQIIDGKIKDAYYGFLSNSYSTPIIKDGKYVWSLDEEEGEFITPGIEMWQWFENLRL